MPQLCGNQPGFEPGSFRLPETSAWTFIENENQMRRFPPSRRLCFRSDDISWQRLHEAIQKLPQNYREAIVLYYLDGRKCSTSQPRWESPNRRFDSLVRARAMLHDLLQEERT